MARSKKAQVDKLPVRGIQALKSLSVQFVSYMIEEGFKGQTLDKIVAAFTRHQAKIISSVLGSAGIAGGAWAAISLWTGSLGFWGSLSYSLGLLSMPVWVPIVGSVAGLTAAGGAIYGVLSLARSRQQTRKLQSIIGFSKMLIGKEELGEQDERLLRKILRSQKVKKQRIEELLRTTAESAQKLAQEDLSAEDGLEIARYLFPLVYAENGVISAATRRRFARVCAHLGLEAGKPTEISQEYRKRLEAQWSYLQDLIGKLNYFALELGFDGQEMELLREQLALLMTFDPRKVAAQKQPRALGMLGGGTDDAPTHLKEGDVMGEAAMMGAYAMAQTATPGQQNRTHLGAIFDALLDANPHLSDDYRKKLVDSRKKVDRLYEVTRTQILAAEKKRKKNASK